MDASLRATAQAAGRDDFEAELASHLAMHIDDGIRAGLSSEEARRQALIRLGGAEQTRQAYRERRGLPWLETLARDLAYSLRRLVQRPAVTAIAVLSIGLGIGANGTIFSMVSRFVLRPAPVGDPSTLLAIQRRGESALSWPLFNDLREQVKSFSGVAGYFPLLPASIGGRGEPERVYGQAVSANFFDVAELRMMRGRGFANNEDRQPVVVLGAGLWHRRFHDDPAIVGKTVTLSGHCLRWWALRRSVSTALTRFSRPSSGCHSGSLINYSRHCPKALTATRPGYLLLAGCDQARRVRRLRPS